MGSSFAWTRGSPAKGASWLKDAGGRVRVALASALARTGPEMVAAIRAEMRVVSPHLHPFTVSQKGSDVPLAGGDLEAAVMFRVETTSKGTSVWAGIPAAAGSVAVLAHVQEHGCTIDVTPRMRGYLASQGLHLRADTVSIVIPPRPFIGPGLARYRAGGAVRTAVVQELSRALKGR